MGSDLDNLPDAIIAESLHSAHRPRHGHLALVHISFAFLVLCLFLGLVTQTRITFAQSLVSPIFLGVLFLMGVACGSSLRWSNELLVDEQLAS
jgi:hypothetical protein